MNRLAVALLALAPLASQADENMKFAKYREEAIPISALGAFLEKYVGECGDVLSGGAECKVNAAAFRKEATGKHFYMIVSEDAATMIQPGAFDPARKEFTLDVTPFFPANGYAMTQGAPKKTDAQGNPVLPLVYVKARLPEGFSAGTMARLIGIRGLRLQVVFTTQGVWTLAKKGTSKMSGVQARIDAMLFTIGRTGEEIAFWTAK